MIDMKMTKDEAKERSPSVESSADNAPEYPWGLSVNLDESSLAKLGIEALPAVGTKMVLMAEVVVKGTSEYNQQDGDKSRNVDLQITQMDLGAPARDPAEVMFGS